ncbi:MAG: RNA polymerase sigma factor [Acidobacteriota bacterium]|nr:RNA polymerase sigma factor [Acidobacteriota bacterium]
MKALTQSDRAEPAKVDLDRLACRARAGSVEAFEAIYRAQVGRVMAVCLRLNGGCRGQAEDLVQETFVRAWQKLALYRPGTEFAAWLRRVAINVVLGARRSDQRRWKREQAAAPRPADGCHPGQKLDLERAIARLPAPASRLRAA